MNTPRIRKQVAAQPIAVEDRSQQLPSERLIRAMEILQHADRPRYLRLVNLAEAYASLHERELEPQAEYEARLRRLQLEAKEVD